jgi:antitoxin FitA
MASVLTIRKLPDDVQAALRQRAAASGRSVEAEAREILASACLPRQTAAWWDELAKRRLARTPQQLSVESVDLLREGRDAR